MWQKASEEDKARHDREMKVFNSSSAISYPSPTPPAQVSRGVESISSCEGIDYASSNHYERGDTLLPTGMVDAEAEEEAVVVIASNAKRAKKTRGIASHIPIAHHSFRNVLSPHFICCCFHAAVLALLCTRLECSQGKY